MFTQEVAYSTAYLAGVASVFFAMYIPIIPVYISILSNGEKKSVSKTLAFVLGLFCYLYSFRFWSRVYWRVIS